MTKLKLASVALLVVATTGLLFGSMGFSSVAADRGVSVAVASDDTALVGYDTHDQNITGDERVELVTVENRLSSSASVTNVTVETDNPAVRVSDPSKPTIGTGQDRLVKADIDCDPGASANVTVSVTVEGEGVTAAISGDTETRTFEVRCTEVDTHEGDVRFSGNGNVHFDGWSQENLTVTYWTADGTGNGAGSSNTFTEHGSVSVDTSNNLKNSLGESGQTRFAAVYVEEANKTYFNDKHTDDGPVVDGKQAPSGG